MIVEATIIVICVNFVEKYVEEFVSWDDMPALYVIAVWVYEEIRFPAGCYPF